MKRADTGQASVHSTTNTAAKQRATTVTAVFRQMFDGVMAAVALPGALVQ
jgi:hypothetical protein